ncbi:putative CFEM domain-containing protein [Seiridium cardinale]
MKALQSLPAMTLINFPFLYSLLLATAAAEGIDATTTTSTSCKPWRWTVTTIDSVPTTIDLPGHAPDYTPMPRKEIRLATSTAAYRYHISIDKFFMLNPELDSDCGNIAPETEYCVGFMEPLRAFDGLCGPRHNNATCIGTDKQCCNSETWTCGDTSEECSSGICYEGAFWEDRVCSTDGTCGSDHGMWKCAGNWGDCCSFKGKCGTGADFCGVDVCQSGNCTLPQEDSSQSAGASSASSTQGISSGARTIVRQL